MTSDGSINTPNPASPRRVGILTTDDRLVITSWDAALASMTGIDGARATGRAIADVVPDLESRGLLPLVKEPLETGAARVLAPALHGYLIPCPPVTPSSLFTHMQQRVVLGALQEEARTVGLVVTVEDVTERLEREHRLSESLRHASPAARLQTIEALASLEPVEGIGPLHGAISDDDWQVRRRAVHALAGRRDPALVNAIVSALRDGHRNFSVLSSALKLLALTGVDLASALIDLLQDPDPDLRVQAALALGTQKSAAAAPALIAALDDRDPNVQFHAIEALGLLAPPEAVEPLARLAESRNFFLAFPALEALARINDPAVAPRIVPLLEDDLVGDQAAEVLGQIGDEDAVAPLMAALDRATVSAASLVGALASIHRRYQEMSGGGRHIEVLVKRSMSTAGAQRLIEAAAEETGPSLREFVTVLGWLDGDEVERALTLMLGRASAHHELIEAVVRFGAPMVDRLVEQLEQPDLDTRRAAIIALGRIGDTRAVPALVARLAVPDTDLLVPLAGALARLGDGRAFEPLLALLGDDDVSVRHAAIGALNSIGHPEMGPRIRILLDDANPVVRESAARIAGYFGYRACADALIAHCADANESVRAAALEHVAFLDDERVLSTLTHALARDTPRARAAAARALAHVEGEGAGEALRAAAADGDRWVRYFSVSSLGRQMDPSSLPLLETLAAGDELEPVRVAAVEAIGRIGGSEAAQALAGLSAAKEPDVALAAVRALGTVQSPTALEPLRTALGSAEPARRVAAAEAIAQWGREPAVELLGWTAAADSDVAVWRAALDGLARIGGSASPAATPAIAALAAVAADASRRADVITALSRVTPSAIGRVGSALSSRDPQVRCAVVEALGRLSHPEASACVRVALEDSDPGVRQLAVTVLARLGTRGLARVFADLARSDPNEGVRRAAEVALRRRRDQDGTATDGQVDA